MTSYRLARSSYAAWAAAARCARDVVQFLELTEPAGWPIITTWLRVSPPGLSRTGFIAASGSAPAARAWIHWARPISAQESAPAGQTIELFDMF
jgi:hypothetical protein